MVLSLEEEALFQNTQAPEWRPGFTDAFMPSMRLENPVVSMFNWWGYQSVISQNNKIDPNFSPKDYVIRNNLHDFAPSFMDVKNEVQADIVKSRLSQEVEDRIRVEQSGASGVAAMLAAGLIDPINFVTPSAVWRLARTTRQGMRLGGIIGTAEMSGTEGLLQLSQETRTAADSAMGIGYGTLLMGVMGGAIGKATSLLDASEMVRLQDVFGTPVSEEALTGGFDNIAPRQAEVMPIVQAFEQEQAIADEVFESLQEFPQVLDDYTVEAKPIVSTESVVPEVAASNVSIVRDAYVRAGGKNGVYIYLEDLRKQFSHLSKEEFDQMMIALYKNEEVVLYAEGDPKTDTAARKAAGIDISGSNRIAIVVP